VLALFVTATVALLAIWLLYPLAVRLAGALLADRAASGAPAGPAAGLPTVTAILASRDDASAIADRVADLLAADYDPSRLGVVVALDRGARGTLDEVRAAVARRCPGRDVAVVPGAEPGGKASALNAALRRATGEILVLTDTHQRFHPDAVRRLVAFLVERPRFGAVSGALDLGAPAPGAPAEGRTLAERYWSYEKRLRADEARVHSTVGVTGAIYAMRRALWAPLPAGVILDDVYTPMRLVLEGHRVGFEDAARAVDTRRFGSGQEYRRKVRTLTGVIQLCAWLPAVLVPVRNPIWLQFLFHKLLRLLTPYIAILACLGALGVVWERVGPTPILVAAALAALGAALPRIGPRVRALVVWGVTLQAAIVVATVNGLRGRWNVW
jgi:cellulose synthase/poly-beta-1,6-N-acetylglucosamine synthase-like glycosyltransferase